MRWAKHNRVSMDHNCEDSARDFRGVKSCREIVPDLMTIAMANVRGIFGAEEHFYSVLAYGPVTHLEFWLLGRIRFTLSAIRTNLWATPTDFLQQILGPGQFSILRRYSVNWDHEGRLCYPWPPDGRRLRAWLRWLLRMDRGFVRLGRRNGIHENNIMTLEPQGHIPTAEAMKRSLTFGDSKFQGESIYCHLRTRHCLVMAKEVKCEIASTAIEHDRAIVSIFPLNFPPKSTKPLKTGGVLAFGGFT